MQSKSSSTPLPTPSLPSPPNFIKPNPKNLHFSMKPTHPNFYSFISLIAIEPLTSFKSDEIPKLIIKNKKKVHEIE